MTRALVIGAGLVGSFTALELARRGEDEICVWNLSSNLPHPQVIAAPIAMGAEGRWGWPTSDGAPYGALPQTVGGRGASWHGVMLSPHTTEVRDWPVVVRDALWREIPGLQAELSEWRGTPLTEPLSPAAERAAKMYADRFGLALEPVPLAVRRAGGGVTAWNPALDLHAAGVSVRSERAIQIELGDAHVLVRGQTRTEAFDRVLCAAGGVENLRLALGTDPHVAVHNGYIYDHVLTGVLMRGGEIDCRVEKEVPVARWWDEETSSWGFVAALDDGGVVDMWLSGPETRANALVSVVGDEASVVVESRVDVERMRQHLRRLSRIVPFESKQLESYESARERILSRKASAVPYFVPLGTGEHEGASVPRGGRLVDEIGRLRTQPNVVFLGASGLPVLGAANPTLSALALTRATIRELEVGVDQTEM